MAGITSFVALPFDVADGSAVVAEPIECLSPAAAIERAQGPWKILRHTGAVAFSRTGDPAIGNFTDAKVIGKLGDAPDDLLWRRASSGPSFRYEARYAVGA
jgi:hypothetical protein